VSLFKDAVESGICSPAVHQTVSRPPADGDHGSSQAVREQTGTGTLFSEHVTVPLTVSCQQWFL
jgi:hypothetical protein